MNATPQHAEFLGELKRERRRLAWRNAVLSSPYHSAHRLRDCEQQYMAASGLENEE